MKGPRRRPIFRTLFSTSRREITQRRDQEATVKSKEIALRWSKSPRFRNQIIINKTSVIMTLTRVNEKNL